MTTRRTLAATACALALGAASLAAQASGSIAGQLNAQVEPQAGGSSNRSATGLNFGSQPGTFTDVLQATIAR